MGADGTLGGQIETEETTNKLRGLVGGGGRADRSRGNHQGVTRTRWWWWKDRWKLGNRPTSHRDSLVGDGGQMEAERADGNRGNHQRVARTRWWWWKGRRKSREPPTSHKDSLVVVEGQMEAGKPSNESS